MTDTGLTTSLSALYQGMDRGRPDLALLLFLQVNNYILHCTMLILTCIICTCNIICSTSNVCMHNRAFIITVPIAVNACRRVMYKN